MAGYTGRALEPAAPGRGTRNGLTARDFGRRGAYSLLPDRPEGPKQPAPDGAVWLRRLLGPADARLPRGYRQGLVAAGQCLGGRQHPRRWRVWGGLAQSRDARRQASLARR